MKKLTVGDLIEILKEYPLDMRVTSYNGQEQTDFVTRKGVRKLPGSYVDGVKYKKPVVDIMGF